ncbi:MAG: 1-acyl-sn-glycerol-3-phosphate acyltransferase [Chloroflexota bacterium]|nr:1-acyl-sn-glycerol-3-phosphate acyltransferase [Chloroflexota bacterium]
MRAREGFATLSFRRRFVQRVGQLLAVTIARVHVRGLRYLPDGAALLASNHPGHVDPLLLVAVLPDPPEIIALADLLEEWVAPLVRVYEPIIVHRDEVDREVLRRALAGLEQGKQVLLFPEARVSRTGAMEQAREGIGYLALKAGVPVVPIAITGTERIFAAWRRFSRPYLTVTVAPPILPERDSRLSRRAQRQALTRQVMCSIAAHLPPTDRGVYGGAECEGSIAE